MTRFGKPAGLLLALVALCALAIPATAGAKKNKKAQKVTVMTRNNYLGADLTPALEAPNAGAFLTAAGEVVNQVHATKYPSVRAAAIAAEIKKRKPDLVGLQEMAWWRYAPTDFSVIPPGKPKATQTDPEGGDFLSDLVTNLNGGGKKLRYKIAVSKDEFDFETPIVGDTSSLGANHNERLTMRDAILVKKGSGIKTSKPTSGTYNTLLQETVAGGIATLPVTRGWTAVQVKDGKKKFRFVNTHLEAFDSAASNPTNQNTSLGKGDIRAAQATQLVGSGGAAASKKPVILAGDMNSDDNTVQDNGDRNAYKALLAGGFSERSTDNPLGCCLNDPFLVGGPNSIQDFDHQVDHVLTNKPKKIKFKKGFVDGREPVNGLYPSDHAALTSVLKVK